MTAYAQTNIQLLKQLQDNGYFHADLRCICDGYRLAMELFTGAFRPSGKTFIDHLVGTASILCSIQARIELVAAGLLHAAYARGDFGGFPPALPAKRQQVRSAVGAKAEEYVFRYTNLEWHDDHIRGLHDRIDTLDGIDREVVLMRLANELEDCVDLGVVYCCNSESRKSSLRSCGGLMVEMANRLGHPALAVEMEHAFRATVLAESPVELRNLTQHERAFVIAPRSYTRRTSTVIRHFLVNGLTRSSVGTSLLRRVKALADGVSRKATASPERRNE